MTVDDLKKIYGVSDDQDLAPFFNLKDRSTVSKWRARPDGRIPANIERKAQEFKIIGVTVSSSVRSIPVVSKVQAGDYGYWEDCYPVGEGLERIECPVEITDPCAFALQVEGDSMYPRFMPGEYVIVDTTKTVMNNDDVVVKLYDGSVMVKRYRIIRDMIFLESYNSVYESIPVLDGDIMCRYKVVSHRMR